MTQLLQGFLGSGDALGRLREHADRLRRLQTTLEQIIPAPLAALCSVANLKGDTLVLLARNGSAAARIKQLIPSLQQKLAEAGTLVAAIQVKVSIRNDPEQRQTPRTRTLSDAGRESLEALSRSLPEDAPLRSSLRRLIDDSRRG